MEIFPLSSSTCIFSHFSSNFLHFVHHFGLPGGRLRKGPGYATGSIYTSSWKVAKTIGNKEIVCFVWLYRSSKEIICYVWLYLRADSFCLITSHMNVSLQNINISNALFHICREITPLLFQKTIQSTYSSFDPPHSHNLIFWPSPSLHWGPKALNLTLLWGPEALPLKSKPALNHLILWNNLRSFWIYNLTYTIQKSLLNLIHQSHYSFSPSPHWNLNWFSSDETLDCHCVCTKSKYIYNMVLTYVLTAIYKM